MPSLQSHCSRLMLAAAITFSGMQNVNAATPAFGTTPPASYGLGPNVSLFISESSVLSACIAVYPRALARRASSSGAAEVTYYQARLAIREASKITARLLDLSIIAPPDIPRTSDGAVSCSGSVDMSTGRYDDVVMVHGVPYNLTFQLTDPVNIQFELIDSSVVPERADVAFVLRGYADSTMFRSVNAFRRDAQLASDAVRALSFGAVGSYRIFDGGIDPNNADNYAAVEEINVIDAALSGWTGDWWRGFRERDAAQGLILINPTDHEKAVLTALRAWLVENKQPASKWADTVMGRAEYQWVYNKVLRYGRSAAPSFLAATRLPSALDMDKFRAIGIIFSSDGTYNTSGAAHSCHAFGIKTASGVPVPRIDGWAGGPNPNKSCFYSDHTDWNRSNSESRLMGVNAYVNVHEILHALGQGGHDRFIDGSYFPYSVMNQGTVGQYPIWNRIYIMGWLGEQTITSDPAELADTYGATDPTKKYLLKLGPASDFACEDEFGRVITCHRYQEKYNGTYVQYRTPYTKDGQAYFKGGVTFEPLNDPSDRVAPALVPYSTSADVQVYIENGLPHLRMNFNDSIQFGPGEIILTDIDSKTNYTFKVDRLPDLSDSRVRINDKSVTLNSWFGSFNYSAARATEAINARYTLTFSSGSIIDRAGNAVLPRVLTVGKN